MASITYITCTLFWINCQEGYLVYECNKRCRCSKVCRNRVLQNGVRVKLEVFKTDRKVIIDYLDFQ